MSKTTVTTIANQKGFNTGIRNVALAGAGVQQLLQSFPESSSHTEVYCAVAN
ncbi:hypothetical protein [Paenibacillus taichungensis]|uniref:hypothetical protein n=1 Tax=Paenibacillus taichungensis TaxID=484184 RepID=UPI0039A63438